MNTKYTQMHIKCEKQTEGKMKTDANGKETIYQLLCHLTN